MVISHSYVNVYQRVVMNSDLIYDLCLMNGDQ